ncbi:anti-sigma regulatory factor (Ser/Thr protein kinase) [Kitasatospora sp. MAP12-15]|uniref:ATP-binding protein n=1 Tax=unclassified Kitasatospora TaxID=2633591 RepID=UPI0024756A76|nr:ATP-binding protein [Kitasatospora sp. MAP12-44]MDH6112270.1 anti-sigma regulatory factor (Ser/Thr protein kinase) [Kitasatospora sp. MAP12-44]
MKTAVAAPLRATRQCVRVMPCEPESAAKARRLVGERLSAWSLPDVVDAAELLVSELVGNAVRHTGCRRIAVSVHFAGDTVRVGVRDSSFTLPCVIDAGTRAESGRGIGLVAALAHRWGVDEAPYGKVVWAEVRTRTV